MEEYFARIRVPKSRLEELTEEEFRAIENAIGAPAIKEHGLWAQTACGGLRFERIYVSPFETEWFGEPVITYTFVVTKDPAIIELGKLGVFPALKEFSKILKERIKPWIERGLIHPEVGTINVDAVDVLASYSIIQKGPIEGGKTWKPYIT